MTGLKPITATAQAMHLEQAVEYLWLAATSLLDAGWDEDAVLALANSYEEHAQLITSRAARRFEGEAA